MNITAKTLITITFIIACLALLSVTAYANRADESIWFHGKNVVAEHRADSSDSTCNFSTGAVESIWFQNQNRMREAPSDTMMLCSLIQTPSKSIWFESQ